MILNLSPLIEKVILRTNHNPQYPNDHSRCNIFTKMQTLGSNSQRHPSKVYMNLSIFSLTNYQDLSRKSIYQLIVNKHKRISTPSLFIVCQGKLNS